MTFQSDDEDVEWKTIKAESFAVIMDFFAAGLPVVKEGKTGDTEHSELLALLASLSCEACDIIY